MNNSILTNSILSAEIKFKNGEDKIRAFASQFGNIVQWLVFHFTLLYGCDGFSPEMKDLLAPLSDPDHPIYTEVPKPVGYAIFPVKDKGYNALAIKYEWPAGKAVNLAASSNASIFPKGPAFGYNGDKFEAHVTFAYVSMESEVTKEMLVEKQPDLSFFDLTVEKVTLEISVKRRKKEVEE